MGTDPLTPGFLVLAAGASRRFGSCCKLASLVGSKGPMLDATLAEIHSVSSKVAVVTSSMNAVINERVANLGIQSFAFPAQSPGIGESIRFGVASTPHWGGWIICLADMPFIAAQTYQAILTEAQHYSLVAPSIGGRRGHPVYFSNRYQSSLLALQGDVGAAALLAQNAAELHLLECDDKGIFYDIDTPENLSSLPEYSCLRD
ncbi:nucleotidyltransferase family protein [Teredinibacter purpureus]|uniref:nucleotidyltransferase family protein n=1 Tax=Teredinibacter purpureus TaxID=2731756 RepID=UPI0005F84AB6|nr:nucleotidyltransferase family protein [Teredinibacter purpureus]